MNHKLEEISYRIGEKRFSIYIMVAVVMMGCIMNIQAIATNGGKMPAKASIGSELYYASSSMHFTFQDKDEVNMYYLSDIFGHEDFIRFSLGDICIIVGATSILFNIVILIKLDKQRRKIVTKK